MGCTLVVNPRLTRSTHKGYLRHTPSRVRILADSRSERTRKECQTRGWVLAIPVGRTCQAQGKQGKTHAHERENNKITTAQTLASTSS